MTRETYKLVVAIGVLINGPLYLAGCFIAGLLLGNAVAWCLALAGAGVTYLSYVAHFVASAGEWWETAAGLLVYLSIALGIAAGLALLLW